jgi:hypothetical protein
MLTERKDQPTRCANLSNVQQPQHAVQCARMTVYTAMTKEQRHKLRNIVSVGDAARVGMVAAMATQLQTRGWALPATLGTCHPKATLTSKVTPGGLGPIISGVDLLHRMLPT